VPSRRWKRPERHPDGRDPLRAGNDRGGRPDGTPLHPTWWGEDVARVREELPSGAVTGLPGPVGITGPACDAGHFSEWSASGWA
jgi:hypothetical protein